MYIWVCLRKINTACFFVSVFALLLHGGRSMLFVACILCSLMIATVVLCSRGRKLSSCMFLRRIWSSAVREQRALRKLLNLLTNVWTAQPFLTKCFQKAFAPPSNTLVMDHSLIFCPHFPAASSEPAFSARFFLVVVELTPTGRSLLHMWHLHLAARPVTMGGYFEQMSWGLKDVGRKFD